MIPEAIKQKTDILSTSRVTLWPILWASSATSALSQPSVFPPFPSFKGLFVRSRLLHFKKSFLHVHSFVLNFSLSLLIEMSFSSNLCFLTSLEH